MSLSTSWTPSLNIASIVDSACLSQSSPPLAVRKIAPEPVTQPVVSSTKEIPERAASRVACRDQWAPPSSVLSTTPPFEPVPTAHAVVLPPAELVGVGTPEGVGVGELVGPLEGSPLGVALGAKLGDPTGVGLGGRPPEIPPPQPSKSVDRST